MKRAVGIHFGHDAGFAVVSERGIEKFLSKERLSRCKHAVGWDFATLERELAKETGHPVGWSITQGGEVDGRGLDLDGDRKGLGLITGAAGRTSIQTKSRRFGTEDLPRVKDLAMISPHYAWTKAENPLDVYQFSFNDNWNPTLTVRGNLKYTSGLRGLATLKNRAVVPKFMDFHQQPFFGIDQCKLNIDDRSHDGLIFMHHLAHAYYGFWASGLDSALIISHDGGHSETWDGGGYFWGSRTHGVQPLAPGGFWMGYFYSSVAKKLGVHDAGKLMGLAPYGEAKYHAPQLIGTLGDVECKLGFEHKALHDIWIQTICESDAQKQADLAKWDLYSRRPPQLVADIAASAQKIFEDNIIGNVQTGLLLMEALQAPVDGLVLVGGQALNCPANSAIYRRLGKKVFIPPACNDEGLALGVAIGAYFKTHGHFPPTPSDDYAGAYLGASYDDAEVLKATAALKKISDFDAATAAELIQNGAIVGIFSGRSEIGPRALGHRSILASPLIAENWQRVNAVKEREPWRPFAPICLEEDMGRALRRQRFEIALYAVHAPRASRRPAGHNACR
jgi:carbamoyltransferase